MGISSAISTTVLLLLLSSSFNFITTSPTQRTTITPTSPLNYDETIISPTGKFEMGFYNLTSSRTYLAIWYKDITKPTVVWVANRDTPLNSTGILLKLTAGGFLQLFNDSSTTTPIWSSNITTTPKSVSNPVAQLLDTGNLVIINGDDSDKNQSEPLWESFDYPGNTFLPSLKFGRNLKTGIDRYLSSWKKDDDPSLGRYTNKLDLDGYPQILLREDNNVKFRTGPWNGERFSGMPNLQQNPIYTFEFVMNSKEVYYRYNLVNDSILSRMALTTGGTLERYIWNGNLGDWLLYLKVNTDNCDRYGLCGAYGLCNINDSPPCGCMEGFKPRNEGAWNGADWLDGCVRKKNLSCGEDGFMMVKNVKLPDTRRVWWNKSMGLDECETECKGRCNCSAYANSDVRNGGSGCLLWFGDDVVDVREYTDQSGQTLYVRLAKSELDQGRHRRKLLSAILIPCLSVGMGLLVLWICICRRRKLRKKNLSRIGTISQLEQKVSIPQRREREQEEKGDMELPLFDFEELSKATKDFSLANQIGKGGFGIVYKGVIDGVEEIAVKRLSRSSRQGIKEFMNEVSCIAKLQHRNLVKLLGCCIEGDERLLVYEYLSNKSLDFFIFDKYRRMLLDWPKRFRIINGIARGLVYLHHDSRQRIIHRDLKTSNILLDDNLNPKISDFGMARMFGGDETEANTKRVVGTYGYMAPEYVVDGLFSMKSDVFSFGVLVLEIVTGKKNRGFNHPEHNLNLLGHAWRLYKRERSMELIDKCYEDESSCVLAEVLRCVHVGLLCVQQSPEDRPDMSKVILMLGSTSPLDDEPKLPGFFTERRFNDPASSSSFPDSTDNNLSITSLEPR